MIMYVLLKVKYLNLKYRKILKQMKNKLASKFKSSWKKLYACFIDRVSKLFVTTYKVGNCSLEIYI